MHIVYKKGDMFESAGRGEIMLHACNTQGSWGAGVAKGFRTCYPEAYAKYRTFCLKEHANTGKSLFLEDESKDLVACLFTSKGYGYRVDSPEQIAEATYKSLCHMFQNMIKHESLRRSVINSPKINSGLFKVPWEVTRHAVNRAVVANPQIEDIVKEWIIWELCPIVERE